MISHFFLYIRQCYTFGIKKVNIQKWSKNAFLGPYTYGRQGGPPEGPPFFLVENSIIITFTELIYGLILYGFVTGKTNPYEHKTIEPAIQGQVYFYKNNWMISGKCKRNFNDIYIFVLKLFYDDYRSSMLSTPSP